MIWTGWRRPGNEPIGFQHSDRPGPFETLAKDASATASLDWLPTEEDRRSQVRTLGPHL